MRGRPKKQRPQLGDPINPEMSIRDLAAATGFTRKQVALLLDLRHVTEDEWEQVIEPAKNPLAEMRKLARARAGKSIWYERRCPHCGGLLEIEAQS